MIRRLPLLLACMAFSAVTNVAADDASEDTVRERVFHMYREYARAFPSVPEASHGWADSMVTSGQALLVDVREDDERNVSIIPGALTRAEFEALETVNVPVITYCTVGYRSGKYAQKLHEEGVEAYNLVAGILGWVHSGRSLASGDSITTSVHVYGRRWNLLPPGHRGVW